MIDTTQIYGLLYPYTMDGVEAMNSKFLERFLYDMSDIDAG